MNDIEILTIHIDNQFDYTVVQVRIISTGEIKELRSEGAINSIQSSVIQTIVENLLK